jgi:hypothetical protein
MKKTATGQTGAIWSRSRTFAVFKVVLVVVMAVEGLVMAYSAIRSETISTLNQILTVTGILQAAAAILLLFRLTATPAVVILFIVFAAMLVVHGPSGNLHFFVYAAGTLLLLTRRS